MPVPRKTALDQPIKSSSPFVHRSNCSPFNLILLHPCSCYRRAGATSHPQCESRLVAGLRRPCSAVENQLVLTMHSIPSFALGSALPRLIHRVHLGGTLPSVLQANLDATARENTDWHQHLYGEAEIREFILLHYGQRIYDIYERISPKYLAARSDLFRYLVMYKLGGVYLDTKSRISRPLNEVLAPDEQFVISQWRNKLGEPHAGHGLHRELSGIAGGEFQQWHVVARAGHPFLAAVIKCVLQNILTYRPWTGVGRNGVLRVTGPIAYTRTIAPLLAHYPHRRVESEQEIGLEFSCVERSPFTSTHYSECTGPVVRKGAISSMLTRGFVACQDLRRRFRS
jgi:hypothetical protein